MGQRRDAAASSLASDHVLITGATSGLGKALAERYAAPGRMLSLTGRDAARLAEVADACRASGAEVYTASIDITDGEAVEAWLLARDGDRPVDILIANAGIGGTAVVPPRTGEDGALARHIMSVNTLGIMNTVTPLLPTMTGRRRGRIVMVGSIQSALGLPQSPVYCASKAAVQVYADGLRRLLADQGVTVTLVQPGFVDTPMSRSLDMPRPFLWTAERAAERVIADIAKGVRYSAFPWPIRLLFAASRFVPVAVVDMFVRLSARLGWDNPRGVTPDDRPDRA